ncbi:MAG: amidohydrolase family protein [Acidobacteria bacterium]|nr:amidohydrolase family protein [Acidobacteriota bacterium]MCW5950325.1 amidohydrolase family protein [Pyrinomonadaceae bacterium]
MRYKQILLSVALACSFFAVGVLGQSYAITNAKIVTVSGATIEKGTIIVRDGLIFAVGANVLAPADAIVIDGSGTTVYPGFIDALTNYGLPAAPARPTVPGGGAAAAAAAAAAAQAQQPTSNSNYPAGLRPEDTVETDLRAGDAQFEAARSAGFTTALTVGRSGIFNGQSAVINLAGDSVSGMLVRSPVAQHFSFVTLGFGTYPTSLLGTFSAFRQMMLDAKRLQELQKAYLADPRSMRRPDTDRSLEALFPVLDRRMPLVINANRENEIVRALDLFKEFDIKGVIAGGQEAWKFASRLKAQNVPVLLSLNFPKRTTAASPDADPETLATLRFRAETPKGPGKLAAAGVKFAFQSGGAASMNEVLANAASSIDNGLSRDAALRAMTLDAAELLGISDRSGSIEAGKIADLVVVKGDLFGRDRFVSHVFVDGKLFEMKQPSAPQGTPIGRGNGSGTGVAATPSASNLSGTYTITIDIPGQPLPATLTLVQSGGGLTGTLVSALGTTQIRDGNVSGTTFSFSGDVQFGGASLSISVRGSVTGNQISGTVDSPQGAVPFSGTKNP